MKIKLLVASLVLVFVFTLALSLASAPPAQAIDKDCNCVLVYCLSGQPHQYGLLHPGERPECQPNPGECDPIPCD